MPETVDWHVTGYVKVGAFAQGLFHVLDFRGAPAVDGNQFVTSIHHITKR